MDKPTGPTSHDVVARVRKALGLRRAGHTGTLDPFASGLMVVLLDRATRLARFVEQRDKVYLATARLGVSTDTDDVTGQATGGVPRAVSDAELEDAFRALTGAQHQRPPAFSAKHVDGQRSYQLARRGQAVELPAAAVEIHALDVLERTGDTVTFRARVSSGTYVRAIARDVGEWLGTGGHLTRLRRERIGDLNVASAIPLEALTADTVPLPAVAVVNHLPTASLSADAAEDVRHGRAVPWLGEPAPAVALLADGRLIGIATATGTALQPDVVLESPA